MTVPARPKIYHILHWDKLSFIVADGCLWCDAEIARRAPVGTAIGMGTIKQRRMTELTLVSHPQLYVGQFVPFYFCPRSVMLYFLNQANHPELAYRGGQRPIVHLEADLYGAVDWATTNGRPWAFTLSNAGSRFFEDRADLNKLDEIDWAAVHATDWRRCKDGKQAEFLVGQSFPWELIERIGVYDDTIYRHVVKSLCDATHKPSIEILNDWYY